MAKSYLNLFFLISILLFSEELKGTIIYVPDDQPDIQSAIQAAVNGDTVIVRPGTYYENIDLLDREIMLASMMVITGDPSYRDQTIIDGGLNGCVITIDGFHQDTSLAIIGFSITNGIREDGGGLMIRQASPLLTDLLINGNFTYNQSLSDGGGVRFSYSDAVMRNCEIRDNLAYDFGAGIAIRQGCSITIENCDVYGNTLTGYSHGKGAGIYVDTESHADIINTTIHSNSASCWGGGVSFGKDGTGKLVNVTITGNSAAYGGGGIYSCYENVYCFLGNSIVWDNTGAQVYFGDAGWNSTLDIAFSDVEGGQDHIYVLPDNTLNWLDENIDADPLFSDPSLHDYSLSFLSPCIDAGTDLFVHNGDTLIYVLPGEFTGVAPDMGAIESEISCLIYVPDDYPTIQQAVNASVDGCIIIVLPGVYYENIDLLDRNITLTSLFDETGDENYISSTIIDGMNDDITVRITGNQDTNCVIKGLTIRNGYGEDGGGIKCVSASPLLSHLIVEENSTYNNAHSDGGGVRFGLSSGVLRNSIIRNNVAYDMGGGVAVRLQCDVTIENCEIYDNRVISFIHGKGGGIWIDCQSHANIMNTIVHSNDASSWGGGLGLGLDGSVNMSNVTVTDNYAGYGGGGLYSCYQGIRCIVGNSIFWHNYPGEIFFGDSGTLDSLFIYHSNIEGGYSGITISNGNSLEWMTGNIALDPIFTDPYAHYYYLLPESPCIDAGIDLFMITGDTVIHIQPGGYLGAAPDMGALEYDPGTRLAEHPSTGSAFVIRNPVVQNIVVEVKEDLSGPCKFILYNNQGIAVIESIIYRDIGKGETLIFGASELPSGIFYLHLRSPFAVCTGKVVVQ